LLVRLLVLGRSRSLSRHAQQTQPGYSWKRAIPACIRSVYTIY
jgi:hypothetical protein